MAETMTLRQRMAMLNLDQVNSGHTTTAPAKGNPPPRPPTLPRSNSAYAPAQNGLDGNTPTIGNLPSGGLPEPPRQAERKKMPPPPPRRTSAQAPPTLPPRGNRRPSEPSLSRHGSQDSVTSTLSTSSALSVPSTQTSATASTSRSPSYDRNSARTVKAPAYDPSSLPKLPPKPEPTVQNIKRPSIAQTQSSSTLNPLQDRPQPSRTPPLPARRASALPGGGTITEASFEEHDATARRPSGPPQAQAPRKSILLSGFGSRSELAPAMPKRPQQSPDGGRTPVQVPTPPPPVQTVPPPVPLSSRPALKPKPAATPAPAIHRAPSNTCLKCRDFSAPDAHGARFPRNSIPSTDVCWLSHQLTDRFPSPTDKARAIFIWLHHNIRYNCEAFFADNVKPSTPASTIQTGLAVCEGYAGLFTALATHAGLESVVVGGHGKGFGYKDLQPGESIPAFSCVHAWSAVRIDDGEWKLIDPCWGAGHIGGDNQYQQELHTECFTMDNIEFGRKHFPQDRNFFFRPDGRIPTWEEYFIGDDGPGENVQLFDGIVTKHGLSQTSFSPMKKRIVVRGAQATKRIYFKFEKICKHWDGVRAGVGKPYVFVLQINGKDGRNKEMIPFQTDSNHWWVDVAIGDLGVPGQTLSMNAVTSLDGKDGRGLEVGFVKTWLGRRSMAWTGVAAWQLV